MKTMERGKKNIRVENLKQRDRERPREAEREEEKKERLRDR